MKLFKHLGLHGAPKSTVRYTVEYLIADSEDAVFDYLNKRHYWSDDDEGADYNGLTYSQFLKTIRGDIHDDDLSWDNAYYGVKAYGWDKGQDITPEDATTLIRLGIATQL